MKISFLKIGSWLLLQDDPVKPLWKQRGFFMFGYFLAGRLLLFIDNKIWFTTSMTVFSTVKPTG